MTRLFIFFLALTLLSIIAMWFVENDGSIIVEWMGYRIQTSVAFASLASIVFIVVTSMLLQFVLWLKNYPERLRKKHLEKKRDNGLTAITEGFAAIAAGDTKQAKTLTKKATNCLGPIPITKLLSAQTAQLDGDKELAKVHYTSMLENKETEIIAIKGLLIQAREEGDIAKAQFLAEKALNLKSDASWAISILLDIYKMSKNWEKAEELLELAIKKKLVTKEAADKTSSVISLARSKEMLEAGKNEEALSEIKTAYKMNPEFVPIITLYTQILLKSGEKRKAARILENSWKQKPHPEVAEIYSNIFSGESNEKRIKNAEKLLTLQPNHPESHLAVAKVAINTGTLSKARNHLKIAIGMRETSSICNLMAELERQESASPEIVQAWVQRAEVANDENAWICNKCHATSHKWSTNCSNCNTFNSYYWDNPSNSRMNVISDQQELLTNSA